MAPPFPRRNAGGRQTTHADNQRRCTETVAGLLRRRNGQDEPTTMAGARRDGSSTPANAALRGRRYWATTGS